MTHRHKNQTDNVVMTDTSGKIFIRAVNNATVVTITTVGYDDPPCLTPTDSNHGSRTDSNTRGGKA